jgi:hypothetical protein
MRDDAEVQSSDLRPLSYKYPCRRARCFAHSWPAPCQRGRRDRATRPCAASCSTRPHVFTVAPSGSKRLADQREVVGRSGSIPDRASNPACCAPASQARGRSSHRSASRSTTRLTSMRRRLLPPPRMLCGHALWPWNRRSSRWANPGHAICAMAARMHADVVALSASRHVDKAATGPGPAGNTARFVLDHAPCPVILLWVPLVLPEFRA